MYATFVWLHPAMLFIIIHEKTDIKEGVFYGTAIVRKYDQLGKDICLLI